MKKVYSKYIPYLYLLPAILIITLLIIYPVMELIVRSFMTTINGQEVFAGIRNYRLAFKDPLLWIALSNNLKLFLCVPIMTVLSLFIAVILFNRIVGWRFYRSIVFVPFILAIPVVGIVFTYILQLNGVLNTALRNIGLGGLALDWLGNPKIAMLSIAGVIIWKQTGFGVVLFLARLMSVDTSLYEAAEIDGANWFKKFINVTIPQSAAVIEFYIIISLIEMLSWVFGFIFVMTGGGPGNKTMVLEYLIYKKSFGGGDFNIAIAISVIVLIIACLLIAINQLFIARREDSNEY